MKLLSVVGITAAGLLMFGCGFGKGAKVPVGTTTLTSAPMTPDAPIPAAVWETAPWEEEDDDVPPPVETWGVRPATPHELATYGF